VIEADFTRHDIFVADECFLTGTAAEIVPVVKADGALSETENPARSQRASSPVPRNDTQTGTPIFD
jgi:Branched-chain amino acid aminotransferase/4-amino-4-deoxychorismate lyase